MALAFAGMVLITQSRPDSTQSGDNYSLGVALAFAAAFFYALAAFAARWLKGTPPHLVALIHVLTGTLLLFPFADFAILPLDAGGWSVLAALGVVHTGLMYILLYGAIQRLPVYLTGALSFIYPIAAVIVDRVAFGHVLQPLQIAGAITILGAVAGMNLGWRIPGFQSKTASG
jgi:drug/metabolite transporter (DMT)-like permease